MRRESTSGRCCVLTDASSALNSSSRNRPVTFIKLYDEGTVTGHMIKEHSIKITLFKIDIGTEVHKQNENMGVETAQPRPGG